MSAPPQSVNSITFTIHGVSSETRVTRLRGREALSELFVFEVSFVSDDPDIDLGLVGANALLTIEDTVAGRRFAHGIVGRLELIEHGTTALYRATLVPHASRLRHRSDCRIFQGMSVVDIVTQVLADHQVDHRLALASAYPTREYCVQYRESDWDFVSRLLEEEGILHFFEHTESAHVLVLADDPSVHEPIPGEALLPYRRVEGAMATRCAVSQLHLREELMTGCFSHTDFHFVKPLLALHASESSDRDTDLEVYDYPGVYVDPKEGSRLAAVRLQAHQARRGEASGKADCPRFIAGYRFELFDHPRDSGNGLYVLREVTHRAELSVDADHNPTGRACYEVEFRALPDGVPFRPLRTTPRPTVKGVQTAIVTGPAGEEVHTDEHGRVKVHFHWDRKGGLDDKSSCWIRVSQLWAGAGYGGMWIPRVGHEVVVDFLDGDPDRPLVIGSVYHGANVPPHPLPAEKTKSTIRSSSSAGGEGANELTFEDKKGGEQVYLHAERDLVIRVESDETEDVGNNQSLRVGGNREKTVDGAQVEAIGLGKAITVGAGHAETIGGSEVVSVGASATKTIGANLSLQVGGRSVVKVGAEEVHTIGADLDLSVGGKKTEMVADASVERVGADKSVDVDKSLKVTATKDIAIRADGDAAVNVKGSSATTVGKAITITCGDARVTIDKSGKITVEGKDITLKASGKVKIDAKKDIVLKGKQGTLEASSSVKVKGSTVNIN